MAIDLGKISQTTEGEYVPGQIYERLDTVSFEGSSYLSRINNNDQPLSNVNAWQISAQKGIDGIDGTNAQSFIYKSDVTNYSQLPTSGNVINEAYYNLSDKKLYVYNGTSFPTEGNGIDFKGEDGANGTAEIPDYDIGLSYVEKSLVTDGGSIWKVKNGNTANIGESPKTSDKWILNNEIPLNHLSTNQTDFAKTIVTTSKNKANPALKQNGFYANWDNGTLAASASYMVYVDIPINGDTDYTFSHLSHFFWKDNAGIYISGQNTGGVAGTKHSPVNARFLTFSTELGNPNIQVEEGNVATAYEPYSFSKEVIIQDLKIPLRPIKSSIVTVSTMYWLAGRELNLYFDSAFISELYDNNFNYFKSVVAGTGKFLQDKFRASATSDYGGTLSINDKFGASKSKNFAIKVAPVGNGNGSNRKVMFIGDSTINNGYMVKAISDFFSTDVMDLTFIGTRTTDGVNHEGRSGWRFGNYYSDDEVGGITNPFFDGNKFSFTHYMVSQSQSMGAGDWVFIQLGINDLYSASFNEDQSNRITDMLFQLYEMIDSIKFYNPSIKIGIMQTTPPAISQDATANLLNTANRAGEYYLKTGLLPWWEKLLSIYDNDTMRTNGIYLIGGTATIDRVNGFPTVSENISFHNTNQVMVQVDDVHLSPIGYKQQADNYIGIIKYFG